MKIFDRLFLKKVGGKDSDDIMKISRKIAALENDTVNRVFASFGRELKNEPITYIVPAVWGITKENEGKLTAIQKEIHAEVAPVINEVVNTFAIKGLSASQEFALAYAIRGWFIASIIHRVQAYKNKLNDKADLTARNNIDPLQNADPMGSA